MGIKAALPKAELYLYTAVLSLAILWAGSWIIEASSGELYHISGKSDENGVNMDSFVKDTTILDSDERLRVKHIISHTEGGLINIIPVGILCYFKHYRILKGVALRVILAQLLKAEIKSSVQCAWILTHL